MIYYIQYAEQKGFRVTYVQGNFSKKTKERRGSRWRCECWGAPNMRALREAKKRAKAMEVSGYGCKVNEVIGQNELKKGKRSSKRCQYCATIYASINEESEWVIKEVNNENKNHNPTPSKSKLVKEYKMKNYASSIRKQLENLCEQGVLVSQIHGGLSQQRVVPSVKEIQHEMYKARRLQMEGGDAAEMMCYC